MKIVQLGSEDLHTALHGYGLQATLVRVHGGLNFSRGSTESKELTANYAWLCGQTGLPVAVPQSYDPDALRLVNRSRGPGYTADDRNPNPSGLGLVHVPHEQVQNHALGVVWADAPGVFLIHAPTGAVAAFSGMWHSAPQVVAETLRVLEESVDQFSLDGVWAVMTPGAATIPLQIGRPDEHEALLGYARQASLPLVESEEGYSLRAFDLPGFVSDQLIDAGVDRYQIEVDRTNTMDPENDLPSKRKCDAQGGPHHPSGIAVCSVVPRTYNC